MEKNRTAVVAVTLTAAEAAALDELAAAETSHNRSWMARRLIREAAQRRGLELPDSERVKRGRKQQHV
jgi:hypothetical protein